MLAYGELSLQFLHLLPVYMGSIKNEWRKKRSFSVPCLISATVLVFLIVYLGGTLVLDNWWDYLRIIRSDAQ